MQQPLIHKCEHIRPIVRPMYRAISCAFILSLARFSDAAETNYSHDITRWQEVPMSSWSNHVTPVPWLHVTHYSNYTWQVYSKDGKPWARLDGEVTDLPTQKPKFSPRAGGFSKPSQCFPVEDGWLVAFNQGEFGAALYWFRTDGKRNYKISEDQIVAFFSLPDGIYAIQGLAHLGLSRGSVIRIAKPYEGARWQSANMLKLPFAPYAISVCENHTMLITLSDSLVSVGTDWKIETLLLNAAWRRLYPNSTALSPDESKLYLGMHQFVGEFDRTSNKLRLLIPSQKFLNSFSPQDEETIHRAYHE